MKKHLLGFAALSVLLMATSCAKETRESADDLKNRVSFRTALGKQTRVSEFTSADWTNGDQLNVYSYLVGSSTVVNNFTLTYNAGAWSYTPAFAQPGYPVRYYSWFPATPTNNAPTATSYTFDYAVKAVNLQEDLIAAAVTTADASVVLPFSHILSQVNFGIVEVLGVRIDITNISVNGVKNSGTYTFGAATPWVAGASTASYAYTPIVGTNVTDGLTAGTSYMGNGGTDYTHDNALMLLPQAFVQETDGTISFTYSLTTIDENGVPTQVVTNANVSANLCDFDTSTWVPGKRYVYLIDFSSYLAGGPITFTVVIDPWVNDDDNAVAETLQVTDASAGTIETAISRHSASNAATPGLSVFPIVVQTDITANETITSITGFDTGDQIRIEFPSASSATFLLLDGSITDWVKTTRNRVVIFTKQ